MPPHLPPLIANLAACLPGAEIIETHISWVILTGDYAYKIKKPLSLGFLDFSTLEKRRFYCQEEIRLNKRLAPDIYIKAIPISGTTVHPVLDGEGPAQEWAVKMRAFPSHSTLDRAPDLAPHQFDAIADQVATFHQDIALAPIDSEHGSPHQVQLPILQNFQQIRDLNPPPALLDAMAPIEEWAQAEGARLVPFFAERKAAGYIRECHGDLHLGNIAWLKKDGDEVPLIFDGIEFNPDLRFIDVISEMAFLAMDLHHRGRSDLAWRTLNRYLELTGDYAGLAALPYYMTYRAMVRAKVAAIRARQSDGDFAESLTYLTLAAGFIRKQHPAMVLMHGVSGSGKTVLSQYLLEDLGAVRLRSDVERKRLYGLTPLADSRSVPGGIYTREAGQRTLEHLLALTRKLLTEGFRVIVDATFLAREWRDPFTAQARSMNVNWCWVDPQVPEAELRDRVSRRAAHGQDASEAGLEVLEAQLASQEPLGPEERQHWVAPMNDWSRGTLLQATLSALCIPAQPFSPE